MTDWIDKVFGPDGRQPVCRAEDIVAHLGAHLPRATAAALRDLHALSHELGMLCWGDIGDRYMVIWTNGDTSLDLKYDPDPARRRAREPHGSGDQAAVLRHNIWPHYLSEIAPLVEKQFTAVADAHASSRDRLASFSTRTARAAHELASVKAEIAALKLAFQRLSLPWNPLWDINA